MILNPKKALELGYVTAEAGWSISEEQIQQAGIDVRLGRVFIVSAPIVTITETEKPRFDLIYRQITPDPRGLVMLEPGCAYSVDTLEHIKVPENMSAFVLHRSTFNRVGIFITGSVYDPGFEGNIGATMYVHNRTEVAVGVRIAQVLFMKTSAASSYKGSYQKQRSHAKPKLGQQEFRKVFNL